MDMTTQITPLYAGILGLMLAVLGLRAISLVRKQEAGRGVGNSLEHQKAMQAYDNFTEYVPLALLLIWFLELRSGSGWAIHAFCLLFLTGRLIHALGVSRVNENHKFRVVGMILTFMTIIPVSVRLLLGMLGT